MTSEAAGTGATAEEEAAFRVGDAVVHPHHGAGVVVVGRRRRRVLGAPARSCVEIEIAHTSLRIIVPCENATRVGLRAVVGRRRLGRIVEVLEDQPEVVSESWAARQKRYRAMLKGGDVLALAAVIRDLAHRHAARDLPPGERALYERSRRVLASELRFVLDIDVDDAMSFIDEHVGARRLAVGLRSLTSGRSSGA
jgi:CarD family transcriptional regulator